jgi:membrane-bound serine protease (ClpP class)
MDIIIILVIVFLVIELIEHVVFPLFWTLARRKKKALHGSLSMLNKVGEVKKWEKMEGYVFINGELWHAVSESPLSKGDMVIVERVKGLTLTVTPVTCCNQTIHPPNEKVNRDNMTNI